ncbi:ABC transporter substrate-binding protein [Amycolatopsis mediterranei S699]|uniref:ABC transport system substrate-binding protein n=2 Tax=Amycolatopsis mediterranei TaxID=33910 RepID=A0A0H3D0S0_AMYMU|nr:MlaD family protein [Amycolatopsis mediterranei]ADJ44225.1 ABC transport system substrate-binding protein [Amycolatopsis mediterranei U32]AEK40961.1 ABC transporter substrate-binding protein [Amycolatopsis mediterranei S699]AFO75938.1 ABC transporter substrate-binding protein [Amycolatopsis mediterranei S699]AGT83067.1 ABC transporter substrate-binding protein [Amycolatopsis mediterranei RB]KDO06858.1 ABC transporter substrate-binding protein [Amycolatopsis mediterranei]
MRSFVPSLIKLAVFAVVTVLFTGILAATIANTDFGETSGYLAKFTDASGLKEGDDVRIAGVKVGQVDTIEVVEGERNLAEVRFDVEHAYRLPETVTATIKYRNLVGQRYLALGTDVPGDKALPEGGTIPPERTKPALNLTVLFNGFKPLFKALSPKDVNQLSAEIISVFQGEGGTITSLLRHTASLTSAIASKDQVIGQVIANLNTVLGTVNARGPQLGDLIEQTQKLVSGLAEQRKPIGDAVSALGDLAVSTTGLLADARPALKDDVAQLGVLSQNLGDSGELLNHLLEVLPGNLQKFTRTLSYGSWFNYYLCGITGTIGISSLDITLPIIPIPGTQRAERCGP